MAYNSADWLELKATGPGFNLPATEIEFKVPVTGLEVVPSDAPTANQIGYTIKAPNTAVAALVSGATSTITTLNLDVGTWLLTSNMTVKSTNAGTDIDLFVCEIGYVGTEIVHTQDDNIGVLGLNGQYSTTASAVVQLAGATAITMKVNATFSNTLVPVADAHRTYLHATRLS